MAPEQLAEYKTGTYKRPSMVDVNNLKRKEKCEMISNQNLNPPKQERSSVPPPTANPEKNKMTKETVRRMIERGMTTEQIAEQFKESYPRLKPSMMKAKIAMLLSDKNRMKKEKAPEKVLTSGIEELKATAEALGLIINSDSKVSESLGKEKEEIRELFEEVAEEASRPVNIDTFTKTPKAALRPVKFIGQETGFIYEFRDGLLTIDEDTENAGMNIKQEMKEAFIRELQELN
jgi:hypothetical protein